jgi:hypothetical protein
LSFLGALGTCESTEIGPDQNNGLETGCTEVTDKGIIGYQRLGVDPPQNGIVAQNARKILSIKKGYDNFGLRNWVVTYQSTTGLELVGYGFPGTNGAEPPPQKIQLEPVEGSTCITNDPIVPAPDYPDIPDHIYNDPITNCTYNVSFQGLIRESDTALPQPVFEISAGGDLRANGGRLGGCTFEPIIYTPGPGGPGGPDGPPTPPIPTPPFPPDDDDGVPWWAGPLLAGAVAAGTNLVLQELAKLFEANYSPGTFTLTAPCDVDENCNPLEREWRFEQANFQQRSIDHQVAILEVLQQHLDWKTPICFEQDCIEGDWRTIGFRSESVSPYGSARLRKRFRYRSVSGGSDDQLVDHWKSFSWRSGPVVCKHLGASWGTPQVWAISADEGKRVIRHAAREAGIDPDKVGRWSISSSRGSRLGVSDTMRVDTTGGYYWITARDGSDNRPDVGTLPDP